MTRKNIYISRNNLMLVEPSQSDPPTHSQADQSIPYRTYIRNFLPIMHLEKLRALQNMSQTRGIFHNKFRL